MQRYLALIMFCSTALGYVLPAVAAELLPSEATTLMVRAMQHEPTVERTQLTAPIIERMRTESLPPVERFLQGEAYFINFEPERARDAFWEFRDQNDDLGRVAWQRLMIIRVNAFSMTDQVVDHDIPLYRKRFGINAHDRYGISYPLMQAARQLAERGEVERALDMVVDEVRRHAAFDAPYFAYRLPDSFMALATEHGRGEEFEELRGWVADGIRKAVEERLATDSPVPERRAYSLPGSMLGTLFEDQRLDYHQWTGEFLELQTRVSRPPVSPGIRR